MLNEGSLESVPAENEIIYDILIVDDERPVSKALERTFKRNDLFKTNITLANDAASALRELERNKFDLVISDFKMPGMNGIELLVKVMETFPETVRILITGFSDINVATEATKRAKVHEYIEKPWDNDMMIKTIHRALVKDLK